MKSFLQPFKYFLFPALAIFLFSTLAQAGIPSVTVTPPSGPTNSSTLAFTVVFSEGVTGFTTPASDLTITSATGGTVVGAIVAVDALTYTVNLTGMSSPAGSVSLAIPAGAATSISTTQGNTAGLLASVTWDGVAPTVTVDKKTGQADPTNASPILFTVIFSEAIDGSTFTAADINLSASTTGGTLTPTLVPVNATTWDVSVAVSGASNGNVIASIDATKIKDPAGNDNTASTVVSDNIVAYDITQPSVTVDKKTGQTDPTNTSPILFTVIFSEAIDGSTFTAADINLSASTTGGTLTPTLVPVNATTWDVSVAISGASNGDVIASINANQVKDFAGNDNTASTVATDNIVGYDISQPTVTVDKKTGQADPTKNSPILFTVVFSEAIDAATFVAADINLGSSTTGGTLTPTLIPINATTWDVSVALTGGASTGNVIASMNANRIKDPAGNDNLISTVASDNIVAYDLTAPSVSGAFSPADNATGISTNTSFVVTFNENIKISTTGGVTGTQDRFQVKRSSDDAVIIDLPRTSPDISISTNQVTVVNSGPELALSTGFYINIGSKVFSDLADNDYTGISTTNTWNFTTGSGVTVNNLTSSACPNRYTTISNIVITEANDNNIQGVASSSRTIILGFDASGFVFNPSTTGVTATPAGGQDISSITVTSVNFTSVTLTVNYGGGNVVNDPDVITISGLKVSYDGLSTVPVHIVKTGGTLTIQGITNNVTNLATLTSATQSALPGIVTTDLTYCVAENIAATLVAVSGAGGSSFTWYSDAALTVQVGTGSSINVTTLGVSTAATSTFTRYVTQTETSKCESNGVPVVFTITPLPVADAGVDKSVCFGSSILLGGAPTLKIPSVAGTYTYAWTDNSVPSSAYNANAAAPNPTVTPPNPGVGNQIWNYTVTITDINGCQGTDVMALTVKSLSEALSFTPGDGSNFLNSSPAQDLNPSIAGGTFSGTGVVTISNPSPPPALKTQFNPSLAGIGSFPVVYNATLTNGCPKSVTNTYNVSNAFTFYNDGFTGSPIYDQYCNNEGLIDLRLTTAAVQQIENYVHTWNTVYVPSYGYNPIVFNGRIRNYYEFGIYGYGNIGSMTYPGGTYSVSYTSPSSGLTVSKSFPITRFNPSALSTNGAYPGCPTCNYAYIAAYVDFVSSAATYPYNIAPGQDNSYVFNISGIAAFNYSGANINVNPVPITSFTGFVSGLVNANQFCNAAPATPYKLTGNKPGGANGYFEISSNGGSTFSKASPAAVGLTDLLNGTADFNPQQAMIALGNPSGVQPIIVHYSVDPGTTGSGAVPKKCIGDSPNQQIFINPLPTVSLPLDPALAFCYTDAPVTLQSTPANSSVRITGPGITDLLNGNARFTPTQAFLDKEFAAGTSLFTTQTMNIVATITDGNGCQNTDNLNYMVNPLPLAVAPTTAATLCYTSADVTLNVQPSSFISVVCTSTPSPFTYITQGSLGTPIPGASTITFDPSAAFDAAVAQLANPLATLQFEVRYTKVFTGGGVSCTNALPPIILSIAPQIPPNISGFVQNNGVFEYCSNEGTKKLGLTPSGGLLYINNVNVSYNTAASTYDFTPGLAGGNFVFRYDVITGSSCLNQHTKTVDVLPSPVANFLSPPKCKDDIIPFNADGSLNTNGTPTYTWSFEGSPVVGQNTSYQFSGTGTYSVNLNVTYPATGVNNLVCSSSLTQDQFVGLIPAVDFDVSELCEGDQTKFLYKQTITTISQADWDFGDGNLIPFGLVTQPITGNATTTGTFGNPVHSFPSANASGYTVTLTGKTSPQTGSCVATKTKNISVLKYINNVGPTNPYFMKALNGEDGFWTIEDVSGNSTWEFNSPSGSVINSPEKAWVTNAAGAYKSNDNSYINSPCFDISSFARPVISLQYWEDAQVTDGAVLQYSTNGGQAWQTLGSLVNNFSSGQNWYNAVGLSSSPGDQSNYGWSFRDMDNWSLGKHSLDPVPAGGRSKLRFRLAFRSVNSTSQPTREGFAFNDIKIEERNRTILVENFTNATAPNAATNNSNFRSFRNNLSTNEIIKIQYQTSFPGNDPLNIQNSVDPAARSAFYGITQVPKAFIDGYSNGSFNGTWDDQYFSLRSLDPSPIQISFQPVTPDPAKLNGKVRLTLAQAIQADKYTLHVAILERQVSGEDFVLRKMLPTASGTILPKLAANATFDVDFSWEVDSRLVNNATNLQIVAFVQELQGNKSVLQTTLWSTPPAINVVTGSEPLGFGETFYPNPADHELTIHLPSPAKNRLQIQMVDQVGRVVNEHFIAEGERSKTISTRDLAGGIYLLQLGSGNTSTRKKIMVVHGK